MALATAAANSLDHIKGALLQFDYAPYVAAGAAGSFKYGGWIDSDFETEPILERGYVEPGNCLYPTASFITKAGWKIRGTLMEASLAKLSAVCGGLTTEVNVVSGTAIWPLTQVTSVNEWQIRLGVLGQSFKSALLATASPFAASTDIYTSRVQTMWKCQFKPRGSIKWSRTEVYKVQFELDCFFDTSVTESTTKGALGIISDTVAVATLT